MKIFSDITTSRIIKPIMVGKPILNICDNDKEVLLNNTVFSVNNFSIYEIYNICGIATIAEKFFPPEVISLNEYLQVNRR